MRNKTKWYSILLIGLALLLASSVIGCDGSDAAHEIGYAQGHSAGYTEGYDAGYDKGYKTGLAECKSSEKEQTEQTEEEERAEEEDKPLAGAIWWYEAKDHIGDRTTVCGPVAGTKYGATSSGKPTWLNIGKDWPSSERFVVIIWGENRGNFPQPPESYYDGKSICVTGLIQEYDGIPQIEVTAPDQIEEY